MPAQTIKFLNKQLFVHKAIGSPDFNSNTVLTNDPWQYVNLWLKREKIPDACFFWNQAQGFHTATKNLPPTSAPLTAYYAILNATKALLISKNQDFGNRHGVSGERKEGRTALTNEMVIFQKRGVHAGLREYLNEQVLNANAKFTLKDLFYNMPFIHRAFRLTFPSMTELFIPIQNPRFVKKPKSAEAWFCAEIQGAQYQNGHTLNKLPNGYQLDTNFSGNWTIRKKQRFKWQHAAKNQSLNKDRLTNYHRKVRQHVCYIHGSSRLWYIKRKPISKGYLKFQNMTLIYAAMHCLSELARYSPDQLNRHFDSQHNWLLTEFISMALEQFIDDIASEITGRDFMPVGLRAQ
ncbi:YaaC family protein [bacterium]|nr:YaaC family protein [bacterium]